MNMFVGTLCQGDFENLSMKVTLRSWVMQNSMNRFYWNTTNISQSKLPLDAMLQNTIDMFSLEYYANNMSNIQSVKVALMDLNVYCKNISIIYNRRSYGIKGKMHVNKY